jgi:hypothetical protein
MRNQVLLISNVHLVFKFVVNLIEKHFLWHQYSQYMKKFHPKLMLSSYWGKRFIFIKKILFLNKQRNHLLI